MDRLRSQNVLNDASGYSPFGPGYETVEAPTTDSSFPRALVLGYNRDTETLVVVFRDKTWVMYNDPIPEEVWENLKYSDSTGKFLKYSGIDDQAWTDITGEGAGALPRKPVDQMRMGQSEGR
jgi:hypothetical protein